MGGEGGAGEAANKGFEKVAEACSSELREGSRWIRVWRDDNKEGEREEKKGEVEGKEGEEEYGGWGGG